MRTIEKDFLLSDLRFPLTVKNPFEYIIEQTERLTGIELLQNRLFSIKKQISTLNNLAIGEGRDLYLSTVNGMKELAIVNTPLQVDLSTEATNVHLPKIIKGDIEKAADILWRLSPKEHGNEFSYLEEYRRKFIRNFGLYREIPILQLLDEDIGLGRPIEYQKMKEQGKRSYVDGIEMQKEQELQKLVFTAVKNKKEK